MHVLDQRILGIMILVIMGALVAVKRLTTGSFLERPRGNPLAIIANTYNLFVLLIAIPAAAIILITGQLKMIDPVNLPSGMSGLGIGLQLAGLVFYALGNSLMIWALIRLGRNYQVGGILPRTNDKMITDGPYGLIRHPMYSTALSISLGISLLIQSIVYFAIFVIYLALILLLIPDEERGLRQIFGKLYVAHSQNTKRLIPYLY